MNIELGSNIAPRDIEKRIQNFWDSNSFWENDVNSAKKKFCTMMPPPNVTGNLHAGHALDNIPTDFISRYKRMTGHDVLWQPGTDHASIATQLLVERDLSKRGINPRDLTKEELLKHAWTWKNEYGGQIIEQLHMFGITPAWSRERFTMDSGLSRAVTKLFVQMHKDGLIYRARRLVNWCPKQMTTVSDLEVDTREEPGKFYYFKYPIKGGGDIEIATTRPETLFGDQAIAVHPENEKLKHLIGKTAIIPLTKIEIPIIADTHADPAKGTGAVKITPAHDMDDWEVGMRHNLTPVCILTPDARMLDIDQVPEKYRGMDRFKARAEVIADIDAAGLLVKIEDKTISTPYSERGKCIIEYMVRDEWFVDAVKLAEPVIKATEKGEIKFLPAHRYNLFMSWLNNIHEWSISRQLWWGHQIPAWYDADGNIYVAESEEEAKAQAPGKELTRDAAVLDTWFSSALWPFSTLGWPDETDDMREYYPTDYLNTGYDIIFFWVARMAMMGIYATGKAPFKTVNIHGIVRDKLGRKMSKTLGNGIDPSEIIEKYSADALRYWVSTAPIGQDIKFNEEDIKRGGKLLTKLWNASKYVLGNLADFDPATSKKIPVEMRERTDRWVLSELNKTIMHAHKHMDKFDTFNAREDIDEFFWGIFCDEYLEYVKDRFWAHDKYSDVSRLSAQWTLWEVLRQILGLYAPFVPFITEELWQKIYKETEGGETLHLTEYPVTRKEWDTDISGMDIAREIIKSVRGLRSERKLGGGARLEKVIVNFEVPSALYEVILPAARADTIEVNTSQSAAVDIVVKEE
ncbi:MAG: valine--tRNA ligase [Alphaproteobacteria bacterium]|nr:valine--tRNA ligase [Alphaproteobacteria bacterium]